MSKTLGKNTRGSPDPMSGGDSAAPEHDDDALMAGVAAGDRAAFAALIRRHQDRVLAHCVRYLGHRAEAEEAAQETFLALWASAPRYEPRGQFRAYVIALAVHRCRTVERTRARANRKHAALEREPGPGEAPGPQERLLDDEARRIVLAHLEAAPPAVRETLILRYVHGLPIEDIARILDEPSGTVRSRLSRGVAQLRRAVEEGDQ
jgi:RNA polymerase sigma-70 factor (ECF subfamily)